MKKLTIVVFIIICASFVLCMIPYERSIIFMETRSENPTTYYKELEDVDEFKIIYTHSIHLTDVYESYVALPSNAIQMLSMEYSDVAIGMPGYAEEGQTLLYENGIYKLQYDDAKLTNFVLHIGNVDFRLDLQHNNETVELKKFLTRGKSYDVRIQKLSLYEKMKGVELNEQK